MKRNHVLILLTNIVLALWSASPALACWPDVYGSAYNGIMPAEHVLVTVEQQGQADTCGPATYTTYTDAAGAFVQCVFCEGTVTITIGGESRTQHVNEETDFGRWQVQATVGDNDRDGLIDAEEELLLARYAPQLRLHSDDWTRPANVPWHLARSYMRFTHQDCSDCEVLPRGHVTTTSITEQCHRHKSVWPWCSHEGGCLPSDSYTSSNLKVGFFLQQHNEDHGGSGNTDDWVVYGHVYPRGGGGVNIQYWFFYPYNDSFLGSNHEGDWEFIIVSLDEAGSPDELTYSQHTDKAEFMPGEVQWVEDTHPVVYAAKGSHANYHAASDGDCWDSPFWDYCNDGGTWWNTWDTQQFGGLTWVGEKDANFNDSNWLGYSGRWGEIGNFDFTSGPFGPAYQWESWTHGGAYEICDNWADDDIDGQVDEADCNSRPDFRINEVNPTTLPHGNARDIVVLPTGSFRVRLNLENTGGGFIGTIPVEFRLSDDTEIDDDDLLLTGCCEFIGMSGYSTFGPLPGREVFLPTGLQAGDYWVTSVVDPENFINEGSNGDDDNEAVSVHQVHVIDDAILLENFDDGVADGFTPQSGVWYAADGSYLRFGFTTDNLNGSASVVDIDPGGVTMEFEAKVISGNADFGAILRFVDEFHHLRVDFIHSDTNRVRLIGRTGGDMDSYITFAEADLASSLASGWHHFRIEDTGCDVTVYVDGNLVLYSSYSIKYPLGKRGFFVNHDHTVAFDNLLITALDSDLDGDNDSDGYDYWEDCNDNNPDVSPGDPEQCNTAYDDNCDGQINEGCEENEEKYYIRDEVPPGIR